MAIMDLRREIIMNQPKPVSIASNVNSFKTNLRGKFKSFIHYADWDEFGSGAKSPSNPYQLIGKNSVTYYHAKRNVLPITNFSTSGYSITANGSYGTTLNTTAGGNSITITQTAHPKEDTPTSYQNGYFCIYFGNTFNNLIRKHNLKFTAKINITDNPLNATTFMFCPNGVPDMSHLPTWDSEGNFSGTVYPLFYETREYLEIRVSGISFTMSDIMISIDDDTPEYEQAYRISHTVNFPSTLYMAKIDLLNGTAVENAAYRQFTGAEDEEWVADSNTGQFNVKWPAVRGGLMNGRSVFACNMCNPSNINNNSPTYIDVINVDTEYNIQTHIVYDSMSLSDFKTWLASNPLELICPLPTPITYNFTPITIKTFKGYNNIWCNQEQYEGLATTYYKY